MQAFERLEREWAAWNGLDPAGMVACASGTAALRLALEALDVPKGSEVTVPDLTMIACARAVKLAGLSPVFVDCGDDLLMDFELIPPASTTLKAIMPVHVYGRRWPTDWLPNTWGIKRVGDFAEAHGVKPDRYHDAACWSFYRNKIVAGEEGGAVWFADPRRAEAARSLRSLGFTKYHDFSHRAGGWNDRMSNAHAALILDNLKHAEANVAARRALERAYDDACPAEWRMPPRDAPWVYDLRVPGMTAAQQDRALANLWDAGIAGRHCFKPMSEQEEFRGCRLVCGPEHRAARLSREVIYLPLTPGQAKPEDAARAFQIVRESL